MRDADVGGLILLFVIAIKYFYDQCWCPGKQCWEKSLGSKGRK